MTIHLESRSQRPRGRRRRSAAARLLRSWVRIPTGAWMFVCCDCCVLSGRGLCDGLITRPEESCRLWYVVVFDLETSRMSRPWPTLGRRATANKKTLHLKNAVLKTDYLVYSSACKTKCQTSVIKFHNPGLIHVKTIKKPPALLRPSYYHLWEV